MRLRIVVLSALAIMFSCSSDDDGSTTGGGNGGGGLTPQATYRITFTPNYSATTHPDDYPSNPVFSRMFVMAHGNGSVLFRTGTLASDGLELYVEEGDLSGLQLEHAVDSELDPVTVISVGSDIAPNETSVVEITIVPETTNLSFVTKISPSPDWFVGIDNFDLTAGGNSLVDEEELILFPFDAGTDSGTTYTAADEESAANIAAFSGSPLGGVNGISQSIGVLKIERIDN